MVVEKGRARVIGGRASAGPPAARWEALLMRAVYVRSYSKQASRRPPDRPET